MAIFPCNRLFLSRLLSLLSKATVPFSTSSTTGLGILPIWHLVTSVFQVLSLHPMSALLVLWSRQSQRLLSALVVLHEH